ncbi:hypothetical protein CfE428DRAFT_6169 [Chthoniobacter flavus Ellin428]|uniref:Uncharacterized protein n=1 Tax=Chthoniobacter flavus Ellin428 TaxID=497964 RepID=B4DB78_9BACT|nr:hypothetical protein [Chthoniobacter flavus]EDY16266.1 hypothetical protein CfE428DRAFT_6169 [Chthoniobacter flavus Ellin428]TCO84735.1 hypothetical protein EV701_13440 [Chthoniobacter flavus]
MKGLSFLLVFFLSLGPLLGAGKYSKEIPKAMVPTVVNTTLTLDARNVSAGRAVSEGTAPNPEATRKTTTHSETLQINVGNLGTTSAAVTVHWFWVGRYATSGNWFRAGEGEKPLTIDPRKSEVVLAEAGDVEGHVTRSAHEHYKSGGNLLGWVVTVSNSHGEIQVVKASEQYLQAFAAEPPPKKR